jgi:hypothetical protein
MEFYVVYDIMTSELRVYKDQPPAGTMHWVCIQADDDIVCVYDKNDDMIQEVTLSDDDPDPETEGVEEEDGIENDDLPADAAHKAEGGKD